MFFGVIHPLYITSWGIMGEAVTTVVMDPTDAGIAAAVENLKVNYYDKMEADGN